MDVQKTLRLFIIMEEPFPLPDDFDLTVEDVFNNLVKKALRKGSK